MKVTNSWKSIITLCPQNSAYVDDILSLSSFHIYCQMAGEDNVVHTQSRRGAEGRWCLVGAGVVGWKELLKESKMPVRDLLLIH